MISERTFTGAAGRTLFLRHATAAAPRGVVIILHGFGEHSGRYLETMERFSNEGFASYTMDLRGFGRSAELIADMEDIEKVVADIQLLTRLARDENPGVPIVLLGHSMGGLLALNQLLVHPEQYDLAITSGPGLLPPENANRLVVALSRVLAAITPQLPVSPIEQGAETRNEELKERDRADDLIYRGGFRARTAYQLIQVQMRVLESLSTITTPILALHGGDDRIMSPRATETLVERIGSSDTEHHIFPGLYHEVLNEPERDDVFAVVFDWLNPRIE